jgi:uncharacterized membrane protein YjjB (DUF3815 family)
MTAVVLSPDVRALIWIGVALCVGWAIYVATTGGNMRVVLALALAVLAALLVLALAGVLSL